MKKLNLGCGLLKKQGYINVDSSTLCQPDILMDLNNLTEYQQFHNEEFDEVYISHCLEHLNFPFQIMQEIHRILKQNAILIVKVPHFSRGFSHAQHTRGFDVTFPYYYHKKFKGGFYGIEFQLLDLKLSWMTGFHVKKQVLPNPFIHIIAKTLNAILSYLANLNPYFCSRIWCFWVGGFEEIQFIFKKEYRS